MDAMRRILPNAIGYRDAPPAAPLPFRRPLAEEDREFHMESHRSMIRRARAERARQISDGLVTLILVVPMLVGLTLVLWAAASGR
jgi:hypothetical protein